MGVNHLILQNLKKNMKQDSLYVLALVFSVMLYFSFLTLQDDAFVHENKDMGFGTVLQAGTAVLIVIILVFLLYANHLFLKRRSKEIGLLEIIGMRKRDILRVLSAESFLLYAGSLVLGMLLGFSVSKLSAMVLLNMMEMDSMASLHFSSTAAVQSVLAFSVMYFLILIMNVLYLKRQSLLTLFHAKSISENKAEKISVFTAFMGFLGIILIVSSYGFLTKLFSGDIAKKQIGDLAITTAICLMMGTYLFYKGSVSLIFQLIRKRKEGYLTLNQVLSLSSIMFRMKSNALMLTVITMVSALSIGLSSLAYISYYSIEKAAKDMAPHDFSVFTEKDAKRFTAALQDNRIVYSMQRMQVLQVMADLSQALVPGSYDGLEISRDPRVRMAVVSEQSVQDINVPPNEVVLTKPADTLQEALTFKKSGELILLGRKGAIRLHFARIESKTMLPLRLTNHGFPVAIVNEDQFQQLAKQAPAAEFNKYPLYIGVDLANKQDAESAERIFRELGLYQWDGIWKGFESQWEISYIKKQGSGLLMFIAGFLGLAFLIASGCILYFKQIEESEEDKAHYTVLRKLGFTQEDLLGGIRIKQMMNFGIPLALGLCHSFFFVKSGWFIFGSEMWTPMLIVMLLYTIFYSVYGLASIRHDKRVIRDSL